MDRGSIICQNYAIKRLRKLRLLLVIHRMIWLLEQLMKYPVFCYQGNNICIQDFLDIGENNLNLYVIILLMFHISYILKARHGKNHEYNPTEVNYRANIEALRGLGVTHILAATACGSLKVMYFPLIFSMIFIIL